MLRLILGLTWVTVGLGVGGTITSPIHWWSLVPNLKPYTRPLRCWVVNTPVNLVFYFGPSTSWVLQFCSKLNSISDQQSFKIWSIQPCYVKSIYETRTKFCPVQQSVCSQIFLYVKMFATYLWNNENESHKCYIKLRINIQM